MTTKKDYQIILIFILFLRGVELGLEQMLFTLGRQRRLVRANGSLTFVLSEFYHLFPDECAQNNADLNSGVPVSHIRICNLPF